MFQVIKRITGGIPGLLLLLFFNSCAKENIPTDEPVKESASQLYFVQSGLSGNVTFRLYTTTPNPDTTFHIFTVFLGGQNPASKDIPIQFEVLDQAAVDRYNQQYFTSYALLPPSSYQLQRSVMIRAGNTSTGTQPLTIDVSQLAERKNYLLPVKFTTTDPSLPIDTVRQVAYFLFNTSPEPAGAVIGTIPQLMDSRTTLFDFYDDLMLVDTVGDLWVYPLGNRETLGEPYKVAGGFANMLEIFHDNVSNSLVYIPAATGYLVNAPTTAPPAAGVKAPTVVFPAALFSYRKWFSGINGVIYSMVGNDQMWAYTISNYTTLNGQGMVGGGGWSAYKHQCFISEPADYDAVLATYDTDVLYAYLMNKGGLSWYTGVKGAGPFTIGDGFLKYDKLFTVRRRDLICFERKDGRIARYKDIDINNFYHAID